MRRDPRPHPRLRQTDLRGARSGAHAHVKVAGAQPLGHAEDADHRHPRGRGPHPGDPQRGIPPRGLLYEVEAPLPGDRPGGRGHNFS